MAYAESRNAAPFDWNAFLNKETFTHEELISASGLAANWVTCACGNQCDIIPRNELFGSPKDDSLANYGITFAGLIDEMLGRFREAHNELFESSKQEAIVILSQIESRSAYLIQQINENK